ELAAGGYDQFEAYLDGQYDLLGVRVVGLSVSDVVKVARAILGNERFAWDRAAVKNFYERPKPSGYRAWHLRTKYYPDRPKNGAVTEILATRNVRCEIQIKTALEDTWAEVEHTLSYKQPEGVSGQ